MSDSSTYEFIMETCSKLKEDDHAFTVEALGTPWDVYRFVAKNGQPGTVAIRRVNGEAEIGLFRAGTLTESEVVQGLVEKAPS